MKVTLRCFTKLAEGDVCDFKGADQYDISSGETVKGLVKRLGLPEEEIKVIFVNNKVADFETVLNDGDRVGLSPPVGGM